MKTKDLLIRQIVLLNFIILIIAFLSSCGKTIFEINFDSNGGLIDVNLSEVEKGDFITLPIPTWEEHVFDGWYSEVDGDNKIGDGDTTYTPDSNITLYAHWTELFTVTYDLNGGLSSHEPETVKDGESVTLPTPTWENHVFDGWYSEVDGDNKIGDGNISYTPGSNITLYAHWTELFTVTYDLNGGLSSHEPETVKDGESVTLPTPIRNNFTFNGWYSDADSGNKLGNGGDTYQPESNIVLYAHWTSTKTQDSGTSTSKGGANNSNNGNKIYNKVVLTPEEASQRAKEKCREHPPSGSGMPGVLGLEDDAETILIDGYYYYIIAHYHNDPPFYAVDAETGAVYPSGLISFNPLYPNKIER